MLMPAATVELEPNMRMAITGSVYFPMDCHLMPGKLMAALSRQTEEAGVRAHYGTRVTGGCSHGNRVTAVQTSGESFLAMNLSEAHWKQ